jgi:hypothetical protein
MMPWLNLLLKKCGMKVGKNANSFHGTFCNEAQPHSSSSQEGTCEQQSRPIIALDALPVTYLQEASGATHQYPLIFDVYLSTYRI